LRGLEDRERGHVRIAGVHRGAQPGGAEGEARAEAFLEFGVEAPAWTPERWPLGLCWTSTVRDAWWGLMLTTRARWWTSLA
jgi:hypothetical protein